MEPTYCRHRSARNQWKLCRHTGTPQAARTHMRPVMGHAKSHQNAIMSNECGTQTLPRSHWHHGEAPPQKSHLRYVTSHNITHQINLRLPRTDRNRDGPGEEPCPRDDHVHAQDQGLRIRICIPPSRPRGCAYAVRDDHFQNAFGCCKHWDKAITHTCSRIGSMFTTRTSIGCAYICVT